MYIKDNKRKREEETTTSLIEEGYCFSEKSEELFTDFDVFGNLIVGTKSQIERAKSKAILQKLLEDIEKQKLMSSMETEKEISPSTSVGKYMMESITSLPDEVFLYERSYILK